MLREPFIETEYLYDFRGLLVPKRNKRINVKMHKIWNLLKYIFALKWNREIQSRSIFHKKHIKAHKSKT